MRESRAYVSADSIPHASPAGEKPARSSRGTSTNTPISMTIAHMTLFSLSFSLNITGSIKVTNRGKVEKVMVPTATLATRTDSIKLNQCSASTAPVMTSHIKSDLLLSFMEVLVALHSI